MELVMVPINSNPASWDFAFLDSREIIFQVDFKPPEAGVRVGTLKPATVLDHNKKGVRIARIDYRSLELSLINLNAGRGMLGKIANQSGRDLLRSRIGGNASKVMVTLVLKANLPLLLCWHKTSQ